MTSLALSEFQAPNGSKKLPRSNPPEIFLRWPGGKRWAINTICPLVTALIGEGGTYREVFLGGGAIFFGLRPRRAVLSDVNHELISTYQAIRSNPSSVISRLRRYAVTRASYEKLRNAPIPSDSIAIAARFLFLNSTSFSGIYRLNQRGEFNVPYGGGSRTPQRLTDTPVLTLAATALNRAELVAADFEDAMKLAGEGDVIYCDPAYALPSGDSTFLRYNSTVFSWNDQCRLREAADAAARNGAAIIVSNAYHPAIASMYRGIPRLILQRKDAISANVQARGLSREYLFVIKSK